MASKTRTLLCPGCKTAIESTLKQQICKCGSVAVEATVDFEAAAQGEEVVKAKKPAKKRDEDTSNRPADQGGRSF